MKRLCNCGDEWKEGDLPIGYSAPCDSPKEQCGCESRIKICIHNVPNLEDGRYVKSSFIFAEDNGTAYYIDDLGGEISFGQQPLFINNFDWENTAIKRATVYDFANHKGYVYDPDGALMSFELSEVV